MLSARLVKVINWILVIVMLSEPPLGAFQPRTAYAASAAPGETTPPMAHSNTSAQAADLRTSSSATCEIYPIALSADSLEGMAVGDIIPDIYNGVQPGNFGWLTWAGIPSEPTLVTSLIPPGDSDTYINPNDPSDHVVSVDDWVQGKPGVSNSKNVRDALDVLKTLDIAVPIWSQAGGQGNNSTYQVVSFARVRLLDYHLPGQNWISVRFLGYTCEGAIIELGKTVDTVTLSPSLDMTFAVDQADAIPGDELTYTTTVTNAGTTLILSGTLVATNISDSLATVAYYDDFISYQEAGAAEWTPLAGTAWGLPEYSPISPAPITSGITFTATGVPTAGVTYPEEGDGIAGTQIASGSTASWQYQAVVVLSPEQANLLLDPAATEDIRNNIHFEVTPRSAEAGQPFAQYAGFGGALQSQSGDLTGVTINLLMPDREPAVLDPSTTPELSTMAPGSLVSTQMPYSVSVVEARGTDETQEDYLARLAAADGTVLTATAAATANGGSISAPEKSTATTQHLPIVMLAKSGPETVEPGTTSVYDLTVTNIGSAVARELAFEDRLPGDVLGVIDDAPDVLEPGDSAIAHASHDIPLPQLPGDLTDTASVLWEDANNNVYGPITDAFTTEVLSLVPDGVLTLAPAFAGPNVTGTEQTLVAILKDAGGVPLPGQTIQFTVTGPNATTDEAITGTDGTATFTYTGTNNGYDSVRAATTAGTAQVESNVSLVHWVTPIQPITTSTIWARFFTNPTNAGYFATTLDMEPVFTQVFPTVNFNPRAGTIPGNTSGVNSSTRPLTNIATDITGYFAGTIPAQGNGYQAGLGSLYSYNAVFTGELTVAEESNITFEFWSDDGFFVGIGNGAERVSGYYHNIPASGLTVFESFPIMGGFNAPTPSLEPFLITVHFPAPGSYPFEIDYSQCCGGSNLLTMAATETGSSGVPPSAALTISPNSKQSHATGEEQSFTVTATDASGLPLDNLMIALVVKGANTQEMAAFTDANGQATFTYTGNNIGTDTVQGMGWAQGSISTYTAEVTVTWQQGAPPPSDPGVPLSVPGWIGSPASQSVISGRVPITLASGVCLQQGTLDYWPADDPGAAKVLATNLQGCGVKTLANFDTTLLANGSYIIRLQGTNTSGAQANSGILVTAEGEYKPGRVRFTITDLTVPVTGLPITIGRTYDSLERDQLGDFGYGWSLAIGNPKLEVDQAHNVTLTMPSGKRSTFYFSPLASGGIFGFLMTPRYLPEPGVYGSLTGNGCGLLTISGGQYFCFPGSLYTATQYTYTDPYGRKFVMSSDGTLKSITDLNNNVLTFTPDGITSSAGLNVPFVRDSQGRIVEITGPENKVYTYEYNATGDLEVVNLPDVTQAGGGTQSVQVSYEYYTGHFFKSATDPRGNRPVISTYTADGRLETITDAAGARTSYSYDVAAHTTVVTYEGDPADPADDLGQSTLVYDAAGYLLSSTNPLGETTGYQYDARHNLRFVTDPLGNTTEYTYDAKGNRTAVIDPLTNTLISAEYNQYGGPTSLRSAAGNTYTITYDPDTFMPMSAGDSLGTLGGYTWDDHGNPQTFTDQHGGTTTYTYDDYGNVETEKDPLEHITSYTYNTYGQMGTRTDPLLHTTTYQYDELGRLVTSTNAEEGITRYEYDAYGNRTAVIDPLGRRNETTYDASNRVVDVIRGAHDASLATTTHYEYDVYGRVTDVTSAYGTPLASTTHIVYDAVGRRAQVTSAYGTSAASTTFYVYDDAGRMTDVTTAYGTPDASTTHTQYDDAGRQTDVTSAYGTVDASTTHYEYDDAGQLTDVTSAYGTPIEAITHYEYDERGRLTITTYPDGSTTSQTILTLPTGDGSVQSTRDATGMVTDSVYDLAGRLDRVVVNGLGTPAPQQITRYEYDDAGRQSAFIDPLEGRTTFTYDDVGRTLTSTQWLDASTGYTSSTVYNDAGQATSTTDANSRTTSYSYDPLGRLLSTHYPGGVSTSQSYDAAGRRETSTDENGTLTRYAYDPAGRLAGVTLADGTADASTTQYAYNTAGQLVSITDALNRLTVFQYDDAGRQSAKIWPDSSAEHFGYDALGNQTSHQLADGHTNSYSYDPMGRLLEASYFDGQSAAFTYTEGGQRETASTKSSPMAAPQTTTYDYDDFLRPEQVTSPDGQTISYAYDDANRRTEMTTWLDATTQAANTGYSYDALGRLVSVDDGHGATGFTYDPVGVPKVRELPNGVTTTYGYNERYQLKTIIHSDAGGVLQSFTYELDDAGMRWGVTEEDGSSTAWDYDDAYRLTAEQRFDPADILLAETTYTYDDVGNRLTETVDGAATYFEYNNLDQLLGACDTEWDGAACTGYDAAYSYDGRGNLDQVVEGVEVTDFTFDAADRLAVVDMPGGAQVAFTYDADGQRITQTANGQTTEYLWDTYSAYGDVVLETSSADMVTYTLANRQLLSQTRNGIPNYYLNDGQGSVTALADATGSITDTYSYDAFGELYEQTGTTENSYLYTGQQFDEMTGLYSLRARYYNPALGRFLSQDTAGVLFGNPVELNRYGYTANNPINYSDPSGYMLVENLELQKSSEQQNKAFAAGYYQAMGSPEEIALLAEHRAAWQTGMAIADAEGQAAFWTWFFARERLAYLLIALWWMSQPELVLPEIAQPQTQPGTEPQPSPETEPQPEPIDPPQEREDCHCNPQVFQTWWFTRLEQPQDMTKPWYAYENRVARADGHYGIHPRDVGFVYADGIEPSLCYLVDAKYINDPEGSIYNINYLNTLPPPLRDDFMWGLYEEFVGYRSSIYFSTAPYGSRPQALVVRTNSLDIGVLTYFNMQLNAAGFVIGQDAYIEYRP